MLRIWNRNQLKTGSDPGGRFSLVKLIYVRVQAEEMYALNTPLNRITTGRYKQKQIAAMTNPALKTSLESDIAPIKTGAIIKNNGIPMIKPAINPNPTISINAIATIGPRLDITTSQPRRKPSSIPTFSTTMAILDCSKITPANQINGTRMHNKGKIHKAPIHNVTAANTPKARKKEMKKTTIASPTSKFKPKTRQKNGMLPLKSSPKTNRSIPAFACWVPLIIPIRPMVAKKITNNANSNTAISTTTIARMICHSGIRSIWKNNHPQVQA